MVYQIPQTMNHHKLLHLLIWFVVPWIYEFRTFLPLPPSKLQQLSHVSLESMVVKKNKVQKEQGALNSSSSSYLSLFWPLGFWLEPLRCTGSTSAFTDLLNPHSAFSFSKIFLYTTVMLCKKKSLNEPNH